MTSYTLPILQTDSQLRQLIERTQQSQQPIYFTKEETDESVAVLVKSQVFERLQKREKQLFHAHLEELQHQLDQVIATWPNEQACQQVVSMFSKKADALWDICPELHRERCVTLMMAARNLTLPYLSLEQIWALNNTLDLMRYATVTDAVLIACHQQLYACGLPPMMGGSQQLAQLYEKEL